MSLTSEPRVLGLALQLIKQHRQSHVAWCKLQICKQVHRQLWHAFDAQLKPQ